MKNKIDFDKIECVLKQLNTNIDDYISSFKRIKYIMELFSDLEYFTGNRTTDKVMERYFVTAHENEKFESCVRNFVRDVEFFLTISKPIPEEKITLNE